MYTTCSELVVFMYRTGKSMNNLLSYCGLVDARIRVSNKDLPVQKLHLIKHLLMHLSLSGTNILKLLETTTIKNEVIYLGVLPAV
jgi:hypothetical protein